MMMHATHLENKKIKEWSVNYWTLNKESCTDETPCDQLGLNKQTKCINILIMNTEDVSQAQQLWVSEL